MADGILLEDVLKKHFIISEPAVDEIDKEAWALKCLVNDVSDQTSNNRLLNISIKEANEKLSDVTNQISQKEFRQKFYDLPLFDQLVSRNIISLTNRIGAYMDYFHNSKDAIVDPNVSSSFKEAKSWRRKNLKVGDLLTRLYGTRDVPKSAIDKIIDEVNVNFGVDLSGDLTRMTDVYSFIERRADPRREFDEELQSRFNGLLSEYKNELQDSSVDAIREISRKEIPKIKKIIFDLFKDYSTLQLGKELPFEVDIAPINTESSSFDDSIKRLEINNGLLLVHGRDKKIFSAQWYMAAGHEWAHGLSFLNSRKLPKSLVADLRSYLSFGPATIEEGRAMRFEKETIPWFKSKKNEYGIKDKELEVMEIYPQAYLQRGAHLRLYGILLLKESITSDGRYDRSDQTEEIAAMELSRITNNPVYFINRFNLPIEGFHESSYGMTGLHYPLGMMYVDRTMNLSRKILGEEKFEKNKILINELMLLGQWCPGVHEEYMLRMALPIIKEYSK